MTTFDVDAILAELKGFQLDAVDHVIDRLYDAPNRGRRFLVADETGLGKSVVARGVIARAIERLERDDTVDRIDIVYVCSNADLAQQNLQRLNVTGNKHIAMSGRLTLLALQSNRLAGVRVDRKVVNLVSFTPGTSFEMGWRTGKAEERALLHLMLVEALRLSSPKERASRLIFQDRVGAASFKWRIDRVRRELAGPVHRPIFETFVAGCTARGLLDRYGVLLDGLAGKRSIAPELAHRVRQLTAEFRAELARASVTTLEPDLVILDEFQRFRHLLDPETGGEAAELAHHLFDYEQAKVLLLSATPYKAYTARQSDTDEDHYSDFMTTLGFLAQGSPTDLSDVKRLFAEYREGIVNGESVDDTAAQLRHILLTLMSRTERPTSVDMVTERQITTAAPLASDLTGYAALQALADELGIPLPLELWKSIPQFGNFMDTYQMARALDQRLVEGDPLSHRVGTIGSLDAEGVRTYNTVDSHSSKLRVLEQELLDSGAWRLLWLPPSMPYLEPGGPYANAATAGMTKRLIFSSWTATPTSIASLLSYGAEKLTVQGSRLTENTADARKSIASRLDWRMDGDRPAAMSALALFWPHPELARKGDPLLLARVRPEGPISSAEALASARDSLTGESIAAEAWGAYFAQRGAPPEGLSSAEIALALGARASGDPEEVDDPDAEAHIGRGLEAHVALALATGHGLENSHPLVANLAVHAPGNIAYRALARIRRPDDETTDAGLWIATAQLSNGLRTLFNRLESTLLLDQLYGSSEPYWQVVLTYCADGNLQAVLDEYLAQLRSETAGAPLDDALLLRLAERAFAAMTLRPSIYRARDLMSPGSTIPFMARFALRYGGKLQEQESARQPEIRNAFNSPFWPFVLASTSVGQEGIDFHWWCHAVMHWNLPSNPVDFEQREGRVNRFAGHAVRKNIATRHRHEVMSSEACDPWQAAFDAATGTHPELGEFAPYWVYPGEAKVERQIITYPLSRDIERAVKLKDALTLYRLTLGQPRQEDMLEMMLRRGIEPSNVAKLDLSPPKRAR